MIVAENEYSLVEADCLVGQLPSIAKSEEAEKRKVGAICTPEYGRAYRVSDLVKTGLQEEAVEPPTSLSFAAIARISSADSLLASI